MLTSGVNEAMRTATASSPGLRVVTWNVGEIYWPWQGNQLKDRDVEAVIEVLDELAPDVVLLQELLHPGQLARLLFDRRGVVRYDGAMPAGCRYDRHVGILVRRELSPTFVEHVLAPTSRGIVEARFSFGERSMRALSLHFDVFRPARRLLQARAAAALIGAHAADLTVAGGDLNYDPLASRRLGYHDDQAAEAALAASLTDVATGAGPTLVGLLRVDRIFAGGQALGTVRAAVSSRRTPLGDHAPLVCDLSLRAPVDGWDEGP